MSCLAIAKAGAQSAALASDAGTHVAVAVAAAAAPLQSRHRVGGSVIAGYVSAA